MTSDRRKSLVRLRLALSVIALLLAGTMVLSGVMCFQPGIRPPAEEVPIPSTERIRETDATQCSEEATEPEPVHGIEATDPQAMIGMEETEPQSGIIVTEPAGNSGAANGEATDNSTEKPGAETTPPKSEDDDVKPSGGGNTNTKPPVTEDIEAISPETGGSAETVNPGAVEGGSGDGSAVDSGDGTFEKSDDKNTSDGYKRKINGTGFSGKIGSHAAGGLSFQNRNISVNSASGKEQTAALAVDPVAEEAGQDRSGFPWGILFWVSAALLVADLIAIAVLSVMINKANAAPVPSVMETKAQPTLPVTETKAQPTLPVTETKAQSAYPVTETTVRPEAQSRRKETVTVQKQSTPQAAVGTVHQIGAREYQQDSLGHAAVLGEQGVFAVVADGMGGLSDGEKVSRQIVVNALALSSQLKTEQVDGALWKMVNQVNENVNRMLGPEGLYKSGSTMVAVLAYGGRFQWAAVGDSRIYLYRQGYASQLNQDHDLLQLWMTDVLEGRCSMEEVLRNPDGRKLTSFIGMGQLKAIDGSLSPIPLEPGDRLVLMTDGVYNVIKEDRLAAILRAYPDVNQAASAIDRQIRENGHPRQDNYTAILLGF